jgi:predicted transcriptional regulator
MVMAGDTLLGVPAARNGEMLEQLTTRSHDGIDSNMHEDASNIVTISVASLEDVKARFLAAAQGIPQGSHISFLTPELLWKTLTQKRWQIIEAMTGAGPISIREVARRVGRDVKAVHGDVTALIRAGVVQRQDGKVVFPYDGVHMDFVLGKAV